MAKIIGGRANLAIARETTRGEAPSPAVGQYYWLPWTSWTFDDKVEKYISREALGVIDDTADQYITERWAEGNIEGEIRDKSFGLLLYAVFGAESVAAAGTAYAHTYTMAQTNQHTSLAILVDDPNGDYMFELGMMESFELTIETGKLATFAANMVSRPSQTTSFAAGINSIPTKATLGSENKFIASNAQIRLASDINNFGPAPEINIQNIKITFNKNLKRKQILGSTVPDDIINQTMSVEGSFQLPYENKIYKDYDLDNTYKAMEIVLENRAATIGGAGVYPKLKIVLPRVGFMDWTPQRPKGELYEQTIGFRAFRDVTNGNDQVYQVVLTNAVATY